jgi:outer membrane immunogenic protein
MVKGADMRRLSLLSITTVSTLALTQLTSAADLPTKAPVVPPPVPAIYNWTGFYVGGNVGGAWSAGDVNYTVPPSLTGGAPDTPQGDAGLAALAGAHTHVSASGFTGGVQAGYNLQFNNIVVGAEVDFNARSLNNSSDQQALSGTLVPWVDTIHTSIKTDWLLTARPRLGVAWNQVLLYVTGGLAVTQLKTFQSQFNTDNSATLTYAESVSNSETRAGWVVGGGLEYALSNHWSVKGEYLYTDFGSVSSTGMTNPNFIGLPRFISFTHTFDLHENIARAGINYKL